MVKRLLIAFSIAALCFASAQTFKITLYQDSYLGEKELTAGQYKLVLEAEKVTLSKGKETTEAPVKVETTENKNPSTTVRYSSGDGKYRIQEIRLGGTNKKLIFEM